MIISDAMNFKGKNFISVIILLLCLFANISIYAQDQTVGLFTYDSASYDGYTLLAPNSYTTTYLIDNYGRIVNSWESDYITGKAAYLLDDGTLLRSISIPEYAGEGAGAGGGFQKMNWSGTIEWEYHYASEDYLQHHDIEPMPNGNVLLLVWDYIPTAEAIEAGRNPVYANDPHLQLEKIVEIQKIGATAGNIVWEWKIIDHLIQDFDPTKKNYGVIADHPELIDFNAISLQKKALFHGNTVTYNPNLDQIVISANSYCEILVIDHSTTTSEAASHTGGNSGKGGDFLYRWGNPENYGAGTGADKIFYAQHDIQWISDGLQGAGNMLVFNNGRNRPGEYYSTVDEFVPPCDSFGNYTQPVVGSPFEPSDRTWMFTADPPSDLYSIAMSGTQRLPNGNTLICSNTGGRIIEVTSEGDIVWEYSSPVTVAGPANQGDILSPSSTSIFKCRRYPKDMFGFVGKRITPGSQVELYPITISKTRLSPLYPSNFLPVNVVTEITSDSPINLSQLYIDTGVGYFSVEMFDDGNHGDRLAGDDIYGAEIPPVPMFTEVSYYIHTTNTAGDDVNDPPGAQTIVYKYLVAPCCNHDGLRGDADDNNQINVADLTFLVNYIFKGGDIVDCYEEGDVNADGNILINDLVLMVNYVFKGGISPESCPD